VCAGVLRIQRIDPTFNTLNPVNTVIPAKAGIQKEVEVNKQFLNSVGGPLWNEE
jgi:hypothetical protein